PPQILETYLSEWVNVSQKKNIQLVAKGIETQAALEQLKALGIQYAQGYQLSKPSPLASSQAYE
ncbi:MAG: EAL domain-containing protein, partial [Cyanobacteria bacterium J06636_28]